VMANMRDFLTAKVTVVMRKAENLVEMKKGNAMLIV